MNCRSAFHDLRVPAGRDTREHAVAAPVPEVIGKVSGPAANIILAQADIARMPIKAILLATLGR